MLNCPGTVGCGQVSTKIREVPSQKWEENGNANNEGMPMVMFMTTTIMMMMWWWW